MTESNGTDYTEVIQTEVDQTASIVYEAAKRASESENGVYRASLLHEEDTHVNLGRTQRWIPEIDENLQFRRPGGGNYITHESWDENGPGTYCSIDARVKNSSKEMTGLERRRMAYRTLEALSETYENVGVIDGHYVESLDEDMVEDGPVGPFKEAVYYNPAEGDVYLRESSMPRYDDPQIAGIGLAEIEIDDETVQIGRVCMYPNGVSEEAVELDRQIRENLDLEEERDLDARVAPVNDFSSVAEKLDGNKTESVEAEKFLSEESKVRGEDLQNENGSRKADPCF